MDTEVQLLAGKALVGGTMLLGLLRIPPVMERDRGSVIGELFEGLAFIRREQLFRSLILLTFVDSFFGTAYIYLMPVFAVDIFEVGAGAMGIMFGSLRLLAVVWMVPEPDADAPLAVFMCMGALTLLGLKPAVWIFLSTTRVFRCGVRLRTSRRKMLTWCFQLMYVHC